MDTQAWLDYWKGSSQIGGDHVGGAGHPKFESFWQDYIKAMPSSDCRVLEVACGDGNVISAFAQQMPAQTTLYASDIAHTALVRLRHKQPRVNAFACNLLDGLPVGSEVDLLVSQFGVEYAGLEAINNCISAVADKGAIALLMHCQNSSIDQDSALSLQLLAKFDVASYMASALSLFQAIQVAIGQAELAAYQRCVAHYQSVQQGLVAAIKSSPPCSVSEMCRSLIQQIQTIHDRAENYNLDEVIKWLQQYISALPFYARRFESMRSAALSASDIEVIHSALTDSGFNKIQCGQLTSDEGGILATYVTATKA